MSNRPNRQPSSSQRVRAAANGGRSSLLWLWIGIAVVFVVAIVGAVLIAGSGDDDSAEGGAPSPSGGTVVPNGDAEFGGPVAVKGADLPVSTEIGTTADPAIGETFPTITGTQFDGSSITIGTGKPMVVLGLAHWCPHCQAEVPRIQKWLDGNGMPSDVDLMAIATDNNLSRGNGPAGKWLRGEGWSVPTLQDDEDKTAGTAIGLSSFPFFVVVDADGKVVMRAAGELTMPQFELLLDAARTGEFPA